MPYRSAPAVRPGVLPGISGTRARQPRRSAEDVFPTGFCGFACAAQAPFDAKDVVAQPGAVAGRLTRCPVSGVVFVVDQGRPHVRLGAEEYVTCCDRCTRKLVRDPRHYLRS